MNIFSKLSIGFGIVAIVLWICVMFGINSLIPLAGTMNLFQIALLIRARIK